VRSSDPSSQRYRFLTADVFTDRAFSGNPLGIFLDAAELDSSQMQHIANEMNLSETVFVLPPEDAAHACRLRIFTPRVELPFAGHPIVGSAVALATIGAIALEGEATSTVIEVAAGRVPVTIRRQDSNLLFARLTAARLPERGPEPPPTAQLAEMLGIDTTDVLDGEIAPASFSAGVPYLLIPVRDRSVVARAWLDHGRWSATLAGSWAEDVYVFSLTPDGRHVHARMFGPGVGIVEDPATGSAAVALPGLLAPLAGTATAHRHWTITQGVEMGRPSTMQLEAELRDGRPSRVQLGGEAVLVSEGVMHVPVVGSRVE
jgi:trans-2,3-dihydro-3-hydroxyanthranilate isomerase